MDKSQLGWSRFQEDRFVQRAADLTVQSGEFCARVIRVHKQVCSVLSEEGEFIARIPGKLFHNAASRSELPAVGDWVVVQPSDDNTVLVRDVLERKTIISRKVAGAVTEEQIIAANVDIAFIVTGLDGDYNTNRIERYLTLGMNNSFRTITTNNPVIEIKWINSL